MELKDKTILITGSTDGVGRVVAQRLGAAGARVLVHGRDATRGKAVITDIEAAGGKAEFLAADLASLAEVRRLAEAVRARTGRLDVLINNAGVGTAGDKRQTSADGHELRFAVNYLAGFLLTSELLALLRASAPARIVNVASAGQQAIDFDDVMLTHSYSGVRAYCQSKLAQILFTIDLAEQLKGSGVTVNALHPASYMNTTMVRQAGVTPWSSVETGADAILTLATAQKLEGRSGLYFDGLRESHADAQAYDARARQQLRSLSLDLVALALPKSKEERS
ncbi:MULTISPECIES: SDR family NAD(P)-dependent oxidoreductase [unclassified Mesorhizobium]|uniref:SDR family NAD(P)-dependent oxidoreductase n=1 Tax=unclassified Mesorhizobium TaxID=325217 RepID=UPI000F753B0D|nr:MULTISPECIES: SDR family NAD(P)-dependent oxidoreductase [unclassified Mesorhizobium]AZO53964.1 SDR family NAD(P)-dependent oxidoreductase [Mesorhizobium sp. M8A.F.Ca.ET.057.01.1.1]RWE41991.1 MAG: SDR family NAD(P)-dependent oxidoreductase [Mesorhizobium sp.]